jgi:hypothetical protein
MHHLRRRRRPATFRPPLVREAGNACFLQLHYERLRDKRHALVAQLRLAVVQKARVSRPSRNINLAVQICLLFWSRTPESCV